MQAYTVIAPEKGVIDIKAQDLPPLGHGQVLFANRFSAISPGTELAFLHDLPNTSGQFPRQTGYSSCGTIIAVGNGVEGLEPGQRVVCRCRHTSHAVIDAQSCLPVPESVPDVDAAVYRLGSIALQGIRKAQIQLGWEVAVLGLGPIGNLAGQLARAAGATEVAGIDPVDWRRELALDCGFDRVTGSADNWMDRHSFQSVIEATGAPDVIPLAFQLAARQGHVVLLASSRGETHDVNFYRDVHKKGLTIFGAHESIRAGVEDHLSFMTHRTDDETVLKLLAGGRIQTGPLVSDVVSFEEAADAYERLQKRDEPLMTIVFRWL